MAAGTIELYIDRGSTYSDSFELVQKANEQPIDLTGYTASLTFATSWGGAAVLTLSSPASGVTIDTATGIISVTATDEQTATLTEDVYYGKLKITISGAVYTEARIIYKVQA